MKTLLALLPFVLCLSLAGGCATTPPESPPDTAATSAPTATASPRPDEAPGPSPDTAPPGPSVADAEAGEERLMQYLSRETDLPPARRLDAPDGVFTGQVRARPPAGGSEWAFEPLQGGWFVTLDLGTQAPAECWIYGRRMDLGAALTQGSEGVFGYLEESLGGLEDRRIHRVAGGAFGEEAYLGVEWLFRAAGAASGEPTAGHVKHLIVGAGAGTVYCMHNEIGYRQAFTDLVRELAASLEIEADGPEPFYREVHALRVADEPVGVEQVEMIRDGDGDVRVIRRGALLLQVAEDRLSAQDSIAIEWSTPDGFLINSVTVEAQDGAVLSEVRLKPVETGTWRVEGSAGGPESAGGRDIDATFEAEELRSDIGERILLRRLLEGDETELTYQAWLDVVDVTRAQTVRLTKPAAAEVPPNIAAAEGTPVVTEMGGYRLVSAIDATGSPVRILASLGAVDLEIERVYVGGTPP